MSYARAWGKSVKHLNRFSVFIPFICLTLFFSPALLHGQWYKNVNPVSGVSAACMEHLASIHGKDTAAIEASLAREYAAYQVLAERALALRFETIKVGKTMKTKMDNGKPLSGDELDLINKGILDHLAIRDELLSIAHSHECWLDFSKKDLAGLGITPETRYKGVMLSLSAALVLYDNYLLAVTLFEGDSKLRRVLNDGCPGFKTTEKALAKVTFSYDSVSNRARVRSAIKAYEKGAAKFQSTVKSDPKIDYVNQLILQSPSYSMVKKWSPLYLIGRKLGFMTGITTDGFNSMEKEGVSIFSMVFGNAVGLVETRKGKLYERNDITDNIRKNLEAGDILLEKTPFRLTDKLIPGYWGHAAIWIGNEEELKGLGIWNDPLVARYHDEIRGGKLVVEALRSGVEMNTLEHFMNVDSVGVLRKPGQSRVERASAIIRALQQVGKSYDFNFDVESTGRVYCSKLIYLCYGNVDWPTKKSLGRTTFTPDDVAFKALQEGGFQIVTFYHDGNPVTEAPRQRMAQLMNHQ